MSQARWALPLILSVGLFSCGGEEPSAPAPDGGPAAGDPAPVSQDSTDAIVDEPDGKDEGLVGTVEDTAESAVEEANSLIEKVTAYLEENKLDLAKQAFAQLEPLKDKLPASYQGQIEKIRSLIEANDLGGKANNLIKGLGGAGQGG